jgi:sterigmatocystin biosynthesis cytochrome P450 monooxygenase
MKHSSESDDPESFIPDRWIVGFEDKLHPVEGASRAFQIGPRRCIGQTLVLKEIQIALVIRIRTFDIRPAYDEWDKLNPTKGIKEIEGNRACPSEYGWGGAHPADGYPCRVTFHNRGLSAVE